jgi:high-affinity nickel-transport protein
VDAALASSSAGSAGSRLRRAALYAAPAAVLLAVPAAAHAAGSAAAATPGLAVPGLLTALALGFGLGMRHATDCDHVVAVATLVARTKRAGTAWLLGAFWGLGHTATIFLVGLGIIAFKLEIPARLGLAMEFSVGVVLAALGLANLLRKRVHAPAHEHGGTGGAWKRVLEGAGKAQLLRSTFVGLVHGLAGSAAVALLVMAAMPTAAQALAYLGVFGAGTLAGMLLISAFMESAMAFLARRGKALGPWLAAATGALSLAFGLWVIWQTGFVDGLFLSHPHWVPK